MTIIENGVSYSFSLHEAEGSVTVYLISEDEKEELGSFWFEKNLEDVSVTETEVNENQTLIYKEMRLESIRNYLKISLLTGAIKKKTAE